MKLKKVAFFHLVALFFILLVVRTGFPQGKGAGILFFEGVIERVSEDLKYIVINETKISLSLSTQIIDEIGNTIKVDALRPQFGVVAQVVQIRDGFLAKKIVIKKRKGV